MGRKRKVPQGIQLRKWIDSDTSSDDDIHIEVSLPKVPIITHQSILLQDLSPTPSVAPSSVSPPRSLEDSNSNLDGSPARLEVNSNWDGSPARSLDGSNHDSNSNFDVSPARSLDVRSLDGSNSNLDGSPARLEVSNWDSSPARPRDVDDSPSRSLEANLDGSPARPRDVDDSPSRSLEANLDGSPARPRDVDDSPSRSLEANLDGSPARSRDVDDSLSRSLEVNSNWNGSLDAQSLDASNLDGSPARSRVDSNDDDVDQESSDNESWIGDKLDEEEEEEEGNAYFDLLEAIAEKWLLVELCHTVSKAASNEFWKIAISLLPALFSNKTSLQITRKTPQFVHLRRKLYKKLLPKIHHSTAYQAEGSDDVIDVPDGKHHEFDLTESHKKVYETASVKVILILRINSTLKQQVNNSVRTPKMDILSLIIKDLSP